MHSFGAVTGARRNSFRCHKTNVGTHCFPFWIISSGRRREVARKNRIHSMERRIQTTAATTSTGIVWINGDKLRCLKWKLQHWRVYAALGMDSRRCRTLTNLHIHFALYVQLLQQERSDTISVARVKLRKTRARKKNDSSIKIARAFDRVVDWRWQWLIAIIIYESFHSSGRMRIVIVVSSSGPEKIRLHTRSAAEITTYIANA